MDTELAILIERLEEDLVQMRKHLDAESRATQRCAERITGLLALSYPVVTLPVTLPFILKEWRTYGKHKKEYRKHVPRWEKITCLLALLRYVIGRTNTLLHSSAQSADSEFFTVMRASTFSLATRKETLLTICKLKDILDMNVYRLQQLYIQTLDNPSLLCSPMDCPS